MLRENKNGEIVKCDGFIIKVFSDETEKFTIDSFSAAVDFELMNNSVDEVVQFDMDYIDCEEKEYKRMIDELSRKFK